MNQETIERAICSSLCADVRVTPRGDGTLFVSTPFTFSDGDEYGIYLHQLPTGGLRISDMGNTLMHLSYEHDISKLREGTRGKVFSQILSELDLGDDEGDLFIDTPADKLGASIFRFGQALTRVHDLSFLNRVRVESTFYEDLESRLEEIVGKRRLIKDYVSPNIEKAELYPVDFAVIDAARPLLVFGVPNSTKAKLATIVLQQFHQHKIQFRSLIAYADMAALPRRDIARLTTAANDQIASIDETDALRWKVEEALRA